MMKSFALLLLLTLSITAQTKISDYNDLRIKTNGIELQVRDYNTQGDHVVFLHFGGGNMMIWQSVVPAFIDRYHVVLIDMRGHGKSDKPSTGNNIDNMARDILGVMDHLNIKNAHVVGTSLGAEVALSLAANNPSRVKSLLLEGAFYSEFGPYGIFDGTEDEFRKYAESSAEHYINLPVPVYDSIDEMVGAKRNLAEDKIGWTKEFEDYIRYDAHKLENGEYTDGWLNTSKADYIPGYFTYRFEDYYKKVECPVLFLPGDAEMNNEKIVKAMNGFCALVKSCRIERVNNWTHPYSWLVDTNEITEQMLEFINTIEK